MFRGPTKAMKLVRVKFARDIAGVDFHFAAGTVAEIPFDLARGLIKSRTCEPTTAKLFTPEPETTAHGYDPRRDVSNFNRERMEQHRSMRMPAE